jgi:hypothetical protein
MSLGNPPCDGETEARAAAVRPVTRASFIYAVETLEDVRLLAGGNARSRVGHSNQIFRCSPLKV